MKKQWQDLVQDFKNYALVLLCVGTFFYIGVLVESGQKSEQYAMMGASGFMLAGAMICFHVSLVYKKKLQKEAE
ncbi:YrhC family protein [Bacillus sp. FJAT-42376]|uniref:YrhC family protein n=1 Tax=Bacillus sp. FJAT-42376 TaxID=2014076 RepID=UPI0013DD8D0D|nr:YrhC family protein [Bacillus sp. FJAT-42376]